MPALKFVAAPALVVSLRCSVDLRSVKKIAGEGGSRISFSSLSIFLSFFTCARSCGGGSGSEKRVNVR